jgi:outer membrane protein insertion porin family
MRTNKRSVSGSILDFVKGAVSITILALVCSALPICVAQQRGRLAKIEVVGLKRLTPEQVIATSELQIGQTVDPDVLDAAAEKLNSSGLFKKLSYRVHFTGNQITLTFQVEEAARNLPVVFENFVWFSDDEIVRAIREDLPFFDGTAPEAGGTVDKIATVLKRLLDGKHIAAQVEILPYMDTGTGKRELVFTAKGIRISICALHFPGAEVISEKELIESSRDLLKSEYSKKDAASFTKYTLFPLYRRIGHLRATFKEPSATIDAAQCADGVSVTIQVDEGLAYMWDKAEWSSNQALTPSELSTALGMKTGELATGPRIDSGVKELRKVYGRKGYIAVGIRDSAEFDDATHRVTFHFALREGPQFHMGNLIINGLVPDLAQSLKETWTLSSGSVFDTGYVEEFGMNALPKFTGTQMQRSPTFRLTADLAIKPDQQKLTVDVVITFKPIDKK